MDNENIDEKLDDNGLLKEEVIIPFLEIQARIKNLKVFLFKDEELHTVYPKANTDIGIALLAKDENSADWNLRNLKRCYLVRLKKDSIEQAEEVES